MARVAVLALLLGICAAHGAMGVAVHGSGALHTSRTQPAYPCVGCCMRGCDGAQSNTVPLPVPTGPVSVVWSHSLNSSGGFGGVWPSAGCASAGSTAWCAMQASVQSFDFGGPQEASDFQMDPSQIPLVT